MRLRSWNTMCRQPVRQLYPAGPRSPHHHARSSSASSPWCPPPARGRRRPPKAAKSSYFVVPWRGGEVELSAGCERDWTEVGRQAGPSSPVLSYLWCLPWLTPSPARLWLYLLFTWLFWQGDSDISQLCTDIILLCSTTHLYLAFSQEIYWWNNINDKLQYDHYNNYYISQQLIGLLEHL